MNGSAVVYDAKDLQRVYGLNRRQAYRVLREAGVRISERRLVVLATKAEAFLAGETRL